MKKYYIQKIIIASSLLMASLNAVNAAGTIDIDYNPDTNKLSINADQIALQDALQQLSETMGFKLYLEDQNLQRPVTMQLQGESKEVIHQLLKPSSAAIAQSSDTPYNVTKVILLPTSTSNSAYLPRKGLQPPTDTSSPQKYEQHMRHYERKLKQQAEGNTREPRAKPVPLKRKTSAGYESKTNTISIIE